MEPIGCVLTSCLTRFDLLFSSGFPLFQGNIFSAQDGRNAGVNKKHQKFIFEYQVISQKSYLYTGCFEKIHICIPKF